MKMPIAAAAVAASLMVPSVSSAQIFRRPAPAPAPYPSPADPGVRRASQAPIRGGGMKDPLPNNSEVPPPVIPEASTPKVPLPDGPLEPYLLTKQNGPFMVLAYNFRGPDAPRQALALAMELRRDHKLPAYILMPKKFPGKSNIRGVPPQAPAFATKDDVGSPEKDRTFDEAAVMVGDEKTVKDASDLLHRVKKIHPVCIDGVPQMWVHRKGEGLSRALRTANPMVPAEDLFPVKSDVMIGKINDGPHNIRYCRGRYTLQIAAFTGRSTFDPDNDARFRGLLATKSPLAHAADDAERLAEALSKDPDIQKTGYQPYVFHDRFSSRVTIGSFDSPTDPAARKLHDRLRELAVPLNNRKVTDTMIVPATELMDLAPIKPQMAQAPPATARN